MNMQRLLHGAGLVRKLSTAASTVVLGELLPITGKSKLGSKPQSPVDAWIAERHSQHWSLVQSHDLHNTQQVVSQLKTAPQVLAHFAAFEELYSLPVCLAALRVVLAFQLENGLLGSGAAALAPLLQCAAHGLPSYLSHMSPDEVHQLLCMFALYQTPVQGAPRAALVSYLQRDCSQPAAQPQSAAHAPAAADELHVHVKVLKHMLPWLDDAMAFSVPGAAQLRVLLPLVAQGAMGLPSAALAMQGTSQLLHDLPLGSILPDWQLCVLARACATSGVECPPALQEVSGARQALGDAIQLPTVALCRLTTDLHTIGVQHACFLQECLSRLSLPSVAAGTPLRTLRGLQVPASNADMPLPPAALRVIQAKQAASSRSARLAKAALHSICAALRQLGAPHKPNWPLHLATGDEQRADCTATVPLALPQHRVTIHPYSPAESSRSASGTAAEALLEPDEGALAAAAALSSTGWSSVSVDAHWAATASSEQLQEWLRGELLGRQRVN